MIVVPIVVIASFHENFNTYYPVYKSNGAAEYWNISESVTLAGYELAYGWSFVSVELLFRGFLVIGLVNIMGRHAILPMVVCYCFIHFGKPIGECISSVFGGYILGVIAYYSRSIFGGIFIHIGLAWLMEITASLNSHLNIP
jgi:membrane protease YdiL (CAAX protease family)